MTAGGLSRRFTRRSALISMAWLPLLQLVQDPEQVRRIALGPIVLERCGVIRLGERAHVRRRAQSLFDRRAQRVGRALLNDVAVDAVGEYVADAAMVRRDDGAPGRVPFENADGLTLVSVIRRQAKHVSLGEQLALPLASDDAAILDVRHALDAAQKVALLGGRLKAPRKADGDARTIVLAETGDRIEQFAVSLARQEVAQEQNLERLGRGELGVDVFVPREN